MERQAGVVGHAAHELVGEQQDDERDPVAQEEPAATEQHRGQPEGDGQDVGRERDAADDHEHDDERRVGERRRPPAAGRCGGRARRWGVVGGGGGGRHACRRLYPRGRDRAAASPERGAGRRTDREGRPLFPRPGSRAYDAAARDAERGSVPPRAIAARGVAMHQQIRTSPSVSAAEHPRARRDARRGPASTSRASARTTSRRTCGSSCPTSTGRCGAWEALEQGGPRAGAVAGVHVRAGPPAGPARRRPRSTSSAGRLRRPERARPRQPRPRHDPRLDRRSDREPTRRRVRAARAASRSRRGWIGGDVDEASAAS